MKSAACARKSSGRTDIAGSGWALAGERRSARWKKEKRSAVLNYVAALRRSHHSNTLEVASTRLELGWNDILPVAVGLRGLLHDFQI